MTSTSLIYALIHFAELRHMFSVSPLKDEHDDILLRSLQMVYYRPIGRSDTRKLYGNENVRAPKYKTEKIPNLEKKNK